jgi:solute carrier family 25 (mitochondrial carnitine/acylcarnitine transporter), member 20/29
MTKHDNEGFIRAAKDITAGSVGGIAQVLTGQPFDIVKVCFPPSHKSRNTILTHSN